MTKTDTARYLAAMRKLASTEHVCQHPGCRTVVLSGYCKTHQDQLKCAE